MLDFLQDDLNISAALACLDEFVNEANLALDDKASNLDKGVTSLSLREAGALLGLGYTPTQSYFQFGVSKEQKKHIEEQITLRAEAKRAKDYAKADEIRASLAKEGISLQDSAQGVIWEKI